MCSTNLCSICFKIQTEELIKVNKTDIDDLKWSCKLTFCVPEVKWDEDCSICHLCTEQLHTAYSFRTLCLQSKLHIEREVDYTCYQCNKTYLTKSSLIEHIEAHNINRCTLCEQQFTTNTQLQLHSAQQHRDSNLDVKTEVKIDYDDHACSSPEHTIDLTPNCDNSTYHTSDSTAKSSRTKFVCEKCDCSFKSSKKLLSHASLAHGYDPSVIKPFRCDKCNSKFSTSSNLLQHKKYHVGKRTHICTFCGKGYITKSDLNTHEKQHLNKREYQCVACPKTFNTNKDLRSHRLVVHTDPSLWNYVCCFCEKRFPIKSNLDQHIRRHTGEKRFGCHICEKRFVDKVVLQKHIKSHSNFRAFKCEHCEKEYKDCKVLEVHLTKVHGIGNAKIPVRVKKYFCHACPKSYFAKNKLTRHMFSHTGEKPFVCHVCDRKFTDKSYVKQHLKTTHNVFEVDDTK